MIYLKPEQPAPHCGYGCRNFRRGSTAYEGTCSILGIARDVKVNDSCHPEILHFLRSISARKAALSLESAANTAQTA